MAKTNTINICDFNVWKFWVELKTKTYLFNDKNRYEAIEKVKTRSEAVQNV